MVTLRDDILKLYGQTFPFHFTKEIHISVYAGLAVPKYSLYVDHLNWAITAMTEFGIIEHFFYREVPLRSLRPESVSKIKTAESPQKLKFITIASSVIFLTSMHFFVFFDLPVRTRRKNKANDLCHTPKEASFCRQSIELLTKKITYIVLARKFISEALRLRFL